MVPNENQMLSKGMCCVNSTPEIQTNNSKDKINNKHTQRTQEFTWFGNLPTSTSGDREKFSL